jgi:uncharacterized membrane protein YidH (DUF202 family)
MRTALAFAITGAGAIKFLASPLSLLLGWCLVILAFGVAAFGVLRFRRVAHRISASRKLPMAS